MLQVRSPSNQVHRLTATAAGQLEYPSTCNQGCRFFQQGACETAGLRGPVVKFARSHPIYSEGETATHSYKVIEGAVRVSRILSDGHRQVLDILLPGSTFGLEASDIYGATAEAVGDVAVLRCTRACIEHRGDADHRREMAAMLSRSLSVMQDHVAMLGHQSAKARVASFLIRLARAQNRGPNQPLDLPVGRQDIADYLGLTIETTCRTLTDLKANKIISIPNRHQIVVHNTSRLGAFAEGEA
jgi:CRP/FNR family nitrogen fixation transcriptional regulator